MCPEHLHLRNPAQTQGAGRWAAHGQGAGSSTCCTLGAVLSIGLPSEHPFSYEWVFEHPLSRKQLGLPLCSGSKLAIRGCSRVSLPPCHILPGLIIQTHVVFNIYCLIIYPAFLLYIFQKVSAEPYAFISHSILSQFSLRNSTPALM